MAYGQPKPQQDQNRRLQQHGQQHKQQEDQAVKTLGDMGVSPDQLTGMGVRNPKKFLHDLRQGKGPPLRRMHLLQAASAPYQGPEKALTSAAEGDLTTAEANMDREVDLRKSEDPMIGQMQDYISSRLGVGLTPEQESAIRGELRAPVEQAYHAALTSAGTAGAAAGVAPGSGVSLARGQQAAQARTQGEANVENQIVQENLQRQRDMENLAAGQEALEERARMGDISAQQTQQRLQLQQLGLAEGNLAGLSNLQEGQREFDVTFGESQREAEMARQAWEKYAKSLEPSGLELASGIVGGLVGGVSGMGG